LKKFISKKSAATITTITKNNKKVKIRMNKKDSTTTTPVFVDGLHPDQLETKAWKQRMLQQNREMR
jgi:hypothetical protein